jgi:CubicO group peptidase (beta-lactamase class C family)
VEVQSGQNLADYVREKIYEPLGLSHRIFFNPQGGPGGRYARSEFCTWRQRLLHGEVSDENCALSWVVWPVMPACLGMSGPSAELLGVLLDLWQGGDKEHGEKPP